MPVGILDERQDWWARRRRNYNIWLVAVGLTAFAAHCGIVWTRCPGVDEFEITAFSVTFQAIGYLFAIALANVCYFLGPLSEKLFRPENPSHYRQMVFGLGVVLSASLPLSIPVMDYFAVPRCP